MKKHNAPDSVVCLSNIEEKSSERDYQPIPNFRGLPRGIERGNGETAL